LAGGVARSPAFGLEQLCFYQPAIDAESYHSSLHSARVARNVVFRLLVAGDVRERQMSFW
jgi:hypothetical protein